MLYEFVLHTPIEEHTIFDLLKENERAKKTRTTPPFANKNHLMIGPLHQYVYWECSKLCLMRSSTFSLALPESDLWVGAGGVGDTLRSSP